MAKKIEDIIDKMSEKLESQKKDIEDKQDRLNFLTMLNYFNDQLFVNNHVISGTIDNWDPLNHRENFVKLVSLIPEKNRLYSRFMTQTEGPEKDLEGRSAIDVECYYILLDEKTVMEIKCTGYYRSGIPNYYTFAMTAYRANNALTLRSSNNARKSIFFYDDYISGMEIQYPSGQVNQLQFEDELASNILPYTNLEETFITPLIESLHINVDSRKRQ